jgi:hypothetical protein
VARRADKPAWRKKKRKRFIFFRLYLPVLPAAGPEPNMVQGRQVLCRTENTFLAMLNAFCAMLLQHGQLFMDDISHTINSLLRSSLENGST